MIESLDREVFVGLTGLKRLSLNSNKLSNMNADVLRELPNLETIDLSLNSPLSLPDGIFDTNEKLTKVCPVQICL